MTILYYVLNLLNIVHVQNEKISLKYEQKIFALYSLNNITKYIFLKQVVFLLKFSIVYAHGREIRARKA